METGSAGAARRQLRRTRRLAAFALSGGLLVAALPGSGDEVTLTAVGDDEAAGARSSGDGGPGHGDAPVTTTARPTTTTAPPTTTTTAPPTTLPPTTTTTLPDPAADGLLELGEGGPSVLALQQRLGELGYWLGDADGNYGQLTRQAVMAFQKAEGLPRDGAAGPVTRDRLAVAGRQAPRDGTGHHIEIDLARQIILVVDGGQVRYVLNTSTGSGEAYGSSSGGTAVATTPTGHFAIDRQIDGVRQAPLGTLYRPKYFNGGIAVHGAGNIPAYPASHGCARVTNAAIDMLWGSGLAEIGTPVSVY